MSDSITLPTTWELRHSDPIAPDQIVLRALNDAGIQTITFPREVYLKFADQVATLAAAIRAGTI